MKKFKLKINYSTLEAFTRFLQNWLNATASVEDSASRMAWVLLFRWVESAAVRQKIRFRYKGDKAFAFKPEEAFAIAYLIENVQVCSSDYLGIFLQQLYGQLHQYFLTINM